MSKSFWKLAFGLTNISAAPFYNNSCTSGKGTGEAGQKRRIGYEQQKNEFGKVERNGIVWGGNCSFQRGVCRVLPAGARVLCSLLYGRSEPDAAPYVQYIWHGAVCAGAGNGEIHHGASGDGGGGEAGGMGKQGMPHPHWGMGWCPTGRAP